MIDFSQSVICSVFIFTQAIVHVVYRFIDTMIDYQSMAHLDPKNTPESRFESHLIRLNLETTDPNRYPNGEKLVSF